MRTALISCLSVLILFGAGCYETTLSLGREDDSKVNTAFCGNWQIIEVHTEIESGRNSNRPALERALASARLHRACIVVSKSRSGRGEWCPPTAPHR